MKKIFAIAWKDTLMRFTGWSEWLFFLVLPIVFTLVLAGGTGGSSDSRVWGLLDRHRIEGCRRGRRGHLAAGHGSVVCDFPRRCRRGPGLAGSRRMALPARPPRAPARFFRLPQIPSAAAPES